MVLVSDSKGSLKKDETQTKVKVHNLEIEVSLLYLSNRAHFIITT